MSRKSAVVLLILLAMFFSGCQAPAQRAPATSAPTDASPTEIPPTNTPLPPPTDTPIPTETPLPTATPGPVVVTDDFSSETDIWGDCENCEWKDGTLFFGPYSPKGSGTDQIFYVICETCGLHTYYRVSADVTFADGYGDRTFGVLAGLTDDENLIGAATVSTLQHALYEVFDYSTGEWLGGTFKKFNAVGVGRATNRILMEIKPASNPGHADIYVAVNGTNVITLLDQAVEPTWAGLYLGWHSVGASYDNFEYEGISVK